VSVELLERPDERLIVTPHLRLGFRWTGDRWTHVLEMPAVEPGRPFASVVEADPERHEPGRVLSPTYQDIQTARDGAALLLMALGRFGKHHFAATFRVELVPAPVEPGHPETHVAVDVADRCAAPVESLAATYTVHRPPGSLSWATEAGCGWTLDAAGATAVLEREPADSATRVVAAEAGRAACRAQVLAAARDAAGTHRLRYRWIVSDPGPTCSMRSNASGSA
jgi:hypothetical protein